MTCETLESTEHLVSPPGHDPAPPHGEPARAALRRAAVPGLMLAGTFGALAHLRHRLEHSQLFLPEVYPDGFWNPSRFGLEVEDRWFHSRDGTTLHGWWIRRPRPRGTLLFCHGNAGNLSSQIGAYRYLQRLGLNIFAFDYRGYGRSGGTASEEGVLQDARAAHDELTGTLGIPAHQILLYGHSLGGAIAIDCALNRSCSGLIVHSSFTDTRDVARVRYPAVPIHRLAKRRFRSIDKVPRLALPKLFIHGADDPTVPLRLGERLFEAAAEPKQWLRVERAGHLDVHRHGGLRLSRKLSSFARNALRTASQEVGLLG